MPGVPSFLFPPTYQGYIQTHRPFVSSFTLNNETIKAQVIIEIYGKSDLEIERYPRGFLFLLLEMVSEFETNRFDLLLFSGILDGWRICRKPRKRRGGGCSNLWELETIPETIFRHITNPAQKKLELIKKIPSPFAFDPSDTGNPIQKNSDFTGKRSKESAFPFRYAKIFRRNDQYHHKKKTAEIL